MIEVIGFGLAGACVALRLVERGADVRVVDDGNPGSTVVAAGLVNPVAGRNFEPSWQVREYWEAAEKFYHDLDSSLFCPLPIHRFWRDEKDRAKFEKKREIVEMWIDGMNESGVTWKGGGWLDTRKFLQAARAQLELQGVEFSSRQRSAEKRVWCTGARGLINQEFPEVEHRSAKGEILTVHVPDWKEERILNRNGWLIPLGNERYRVGATYEWDELESGPTPEGRAKVERILRSFCDLPFTVEDHVAGIRPIIERSRPVILKSDQGWMFNGLGSKGVIYAPLSAVYLVEQIL
ncbi:MAG: NAD(P)/FAD-dependent oxidoreductase [Akkermansiaceae bacterium]